MLHEPRSASDPTAGARIIDAATRRLAANGVRGTTLRAVAEAAGTSLAAVSSQFASKDELIVACFDAACGRDIARVAALPAAAGTLHLGNASVADLLWTLCEASPGHDSIDLVVLLEMWLQTPQNPAYADVCRRWIIARRDGFRCIAAAFKFAPDIADLLSLQIASESVFAVSCHGFPAWRLAARAGFAEAVARLTGHPQGVEAAVAAELGRHFHTDTAPPLPPPSDNPGWGRTMIIDAAATIIEEEGLSAVTNRAVAARAGLSLASTTYHFRNIDDLAYHGVLRLFERARASAGMVPRLQGTMASARAWIAGRANPSPVERVGTRGMAEISLAAARGQLPLELGIGIRRQRGTITHAMLCASGFADVSRGCVASHALWFAGVFLTVAAVPDAEQLFDFEAQAEIAARALFGFA